MGQSAISYASWFPEADIYSFEPIQSSYHALVANLSSFEKIKPVKLAFSDQNCSLQVAISNIDCDSSNSLRSHPTQLPGSRLESVDCSRLDDWIRVHNIDSIDFMKIDVEGFELKVIGGSTDMFARGIVKLALFEAGLGSLNQCNTPLSDIISEMNAFGYELVAFYETSLVQLRQGKHYTNALFVAPSVTANLPPLIPKITNKSWPFTTSEC